MNKIEIENITNEYIQIFTKECEEWTEDDCNKAITRRLHLHWSENTKAYVWNEGFIETVFNNFENYNGRPPKNHYADTRICEEIAKAIVDAAEIVGKGILESLTNLNNELLADAEKIELQSIHKEYLQIFRE